MRAVTGWYRDGKWNHLAYGHDATQAPVPQLKTQAGWAGAKWEKRHGWLVDGKVILEGGGK